MWQTNVEKITTTEPWLNVKLKWKLLPPTFR